MDRFSETDIIKSMAEEQEDEFKRLNLCLNNIMPVLAAYIAFKRKYHDTSEQIISKCTNKLYMQIWKDWIKSRK